MNGPASRVGAARWRLGATMALALAGCTPRPPSGPTAPDALAVPAPLTATAATTPTAAPPELA